MILFGIKYSGHDLLYNVSYRA